MARMVSNVCAFPPRTAFLAAALLRFAAARPGCRALVLSERRNHLVEDALDEIARQYRFDRALTGR